MDILIGLFAVSIYPFSIFLISLSLKFSNWICDKHNSKIDKLNSSRGD